MTKALIAVVGVWNSFLTPWTRRICIQNQSITSCLVSTLIAVTVSYVRSFFFFYCARSYLWRNLCFKMQVILVAACMIFVFFLFQLWLSIQFSSVAQSYPTLFDPMGYSTSGFPVHHQLLELAQTRVHPVGDAIQPSHPLSSPSPPAFNLSQHQGLFQEVSSSHQVTKVLDFQLQHQSFQWIFRSDFL